MVHAEPPPFVEAIRDALAGAPVERAHARWSAHPPAPWHAWLLVALARQISAQRRTLRLWRTLSVGDGDHELRDVPGMRGWSYQVQGARLSLIGPESQLIGVEDHGDEGMTIHHHDFTNAVNTITEPGLPEQRLLDLLPCDILITNDNLLSDAIAQMTAMGLVRPGAHALAFRIAPALEDAAEALAGVDFSAPGARERWAEHLGDHLLLRGGRALAQHQHYVRYLESGLDRMPVGFLLALEPWLSPRAFVAACAKVIDGPIGPPAGTAVERLEEHPDYPVCPAVARLLERADPERHAAFAIHVAARYLFRRGLDGPLARRVVLAFADARYDAGPNSAWLGALALLLLEHAPAHALPAIRRGLRMGNSTGQRTLATALALLDQPWCHRELFRALNEARMFEGTAALREALRQSSAPGARDVVRRWEETHVQVHPPSRTSPAPTWGEMLEAQSRATFEYEAEELRPWAEAVRPAIEPDFDRMALA